MCTAIAAPGRATPLSQAAIWLRPIRPVEPGPDRTAGVVTVDAPFVGDGADDIQAVVPGGIDHSLVPRAAVVLDFDLNVMVWADGGPDGEGAAGQARMAVQGGVGRELGGAQDRVICPRIVAEHHAQVRAYSADVLGDSWVAGSERRCVGCWGVHGSSR